MFTQCEKCKAIFRVNLKEVTAAKGMLRCGECYTVFNATKTLSTSMPEAFQEIVDLSKANPDLSFSRTRQETSKEPLLNKSKQQNANHTQKKSTNQNFYIKQAKTSINKYLIFAVLLLITLFAFQVFYNLKLKESEEPRHEPEKMQMVTYNVFAHPKETGVLLISATIENKAKNAQPYPIIEVTLSDSKQKVIALRRFRPIEYLTQYKKQMMLASGQQSNISLKISDPGSKATRFQYKFY